MLHSRYSADLIDEQVCTIEDNVRKFRRYGTVTNKTVRNLRGEEGKIGTVERDDAETAYVIFYPDGTYDRFENVDDVTYRDGWFGPDLVTGAVNEPKIEKFTKTELPEALENLITMKPVARKRPGRPKKITTPAPSASDAFLATIAMAEKAAKINKKITVAEEKETAKRKKASTKAAATKRKTKEAKPKVAAAPKTSTKGFAQKSTKSKKTIH